jgi:hypothetical protein
MFSDILSNFICVIHKEKEVTVMIIVLNFWMRKIMKFRGLKSNGSNSYL